MAHNLIPPEELAKVGKQVWGELVEELADKTITMPKRFLRDLLMQYCRAYCLSELAHRELQELGSITITNANGTVGRAPQLHVISDAEKTMDRVLRRLGLQQKACETEQAEDFDL